MNNRLKASIKAAIFTLIFAVFHWPFASAAADAVVLEHSTARLISASNNITAGTQLKLGAHILLEEGWHTYGDNPGDAGIPTTIEWKMPEGFSAGEIGFPPTKTFNEAGLTTYGYEGEVVLPVTITVPEEIAETVTISARIDYLICMEICIPQIANVEITLPRGEFTPSDDVDLLERFTNVSRINEDAKVEIKAPDFDNNISGNSKISLPLALVFAFLGGVILNLMPCVFPVLSLKALAVTKYKRTELRHAKREAIAYTLGILVCFWTIVAFLIGAQSAGSAIGWGYQFQSTGFVGILALLLFVVGLNLSGVFDLPVLFGNAAGRISNPHSTKGSFATGVLATLVATPCTAPFMAPAIGFALTQQPVFAFVIFTFLGLGMASPFLLISYFPPLMRMFPKPGRWMESFKQFLAFPMYASAVWLCWVVGSQAGYMGMALLLLFAVIVAFLIWMKSRFGTHSRWCHIAIVFVLMALAATLAQGLSRIGSAPVSNTLHGENSIAYSDEKLAELRGEGVPVFLDATATWCITCQVNYLNATGTEAVQNSFKENGVTFMVADWTKKDAAITKLLAEFGFQGVPMNVYFPPFGEPVILPQVLTPSIIIETIKQKPITKE